MAPKDEQTTEATEPVLEIIEAPAEEPAEAGTDEGGKSLPETAAEELPAPEATEGAEDSADVETEEDAEDAEQDEEPAPAAPSVPGFGLLFQAPTAAPARPRRRPEPEPEPELDDEDDDQVDDQDEAQEASASDDAQGGGQGSRRSRGGRGSRGRSDAEADTGADDESSDQDDDQDAGEDQGDDEQGGSGRGGRRRRRRGGRGRNRSSDGTEDSSDQGDDDSPSGTSDSGDSDSGQHDEGSGDDSDDTGDSGDPSGSGSRRRRRRRRSGGGSSGGEQDDPPGTVTRVREGRRERDEPKGVKGSTRLEAKKQRRREGREAGRRRTIITEAEFLARRESVDRVMVVRGTGERTQIGVLEDGVLVEHYVSRETTSTMVGNVYLGRVQNVLPSMEAAFVDIGKGRNAVLYAGEVNWEAQGVGNGQARRIENALSSGDSVLVQVTKDPIGHKGARLTSQISLPGRYLVYVPEGNMTGISRKLPDTERARLKSILKEVVPDSAGVIVRTAAEGAAEDELRRDVERLTKTWDKLKAKAEQKQGKKASAGGAPTILHAEPDMTVRVIRDIFNEDFSSMVVQGDEAWQQITSYVGDVAPDLADRLTKFTGEGDVFAEHRIDEAIAKAMDRKVWLPSGGSLVIDRTEAMTVVDVNTGKFTGSGGNLEETVTKNNLEAAEEIVRQLRLRDIGGIIVIDFIDMVLESNRDLVVRRLLECLGRDRTKHQVAEVTSLGLVQMTRKRVGSGLIEVFSESCEHCSGRGILVHSEPVEPSSGSGGGGGSRRDGAKGDRGGRRGGNGSGGNGKNGGNGNGAKESNGPSAAQIAAAAHAAALKSIAGEPVEDDVAELPTVHELDGDEDTTTPVPEERAEPTSVPEEQAEPTPVPEERAEPTSVPEERGTSLEGSDADPQPAPRRRRGGRRAASSAGAPVTLEAVDLTASVAPAQPLTTVAAESAPTEGTPAAEPEPEAPAAPARRKRKRVTAEAGPPTTPQPTTEG